VSLQRLSDARKRVRRPFVSPVISSAKKVCLQEDQVVRRQNSASSSIPSSSNKELLAERRQLLEKIKEKEVKLQQLKNADEMEKVKNSKLQVILLSSLVRRAGQANQKMEGS